MRIPLHARDTLTEEALLKKIQAKGRDNYEIDPDGAAMITKRILTNSMALPAKLGPKLRYHAFRMIHNALPTAGRFQEDSLCKACSSHQDSAKHFYGTCKTIKVAARRLVRTHPTIPDITILPGADWDHFRFRTPCSPGAMKVLLAFALAAWNSRSLPSANAVATSTCALFLSYYNSMTPKPKKPRDRTAECEVFYRHYRSLDPSAGRAFTDGSSLACGAGGAGFVSILCDGKTRQLSVPLGLASNNAAELAALKALFISTYETLRDHPSIPRRPLYVFTDNQYAINSAEGKNRNRTNKLLIQETQAALRTLRSLIPVFLGWVPGHAGVEMNEVSDGLAKRGAQGILSDLPLAPPDPKPAPRNCGILRPSSHPTTNDSGQDFDDDELQALKPNTPYSLRARSASVMRKPAPGSRILVRLTTP